MIKLSEYYGEKLNGDLRAEFVLDPRGDPQFVTGDALKNYRIRVFFESHSPNVQQVVYKLDPTYYDPIRESTDSNNQFAIETTTYGDFYLSADIDLGSESVRTQQAQLSQLLRKSHEGTSNRAIPKAIEDIENN